MTDERGQVLQSEKDKNAKLRPIKAGSVEELIWQLMCAEKN
nr:hypothetical protein [Polymorphobacter arshaanensis]